MQTNTFKNTMWLGLAYGIRMGFQAAVFVLLARALGVQSFGVLAAAIAAANIIAPIVEYGAYNLSVSDIVAGSPVMQALGVSLVLSVFLLPINLLLLSLIKVFLIPQVPWTIVFCVGLVVFVGNRMITLANTIHIAQGELWRNAVVETSNAVSLVIAVLLFMYFRLSIETWVTFWLFQSFVVGGFALIWVSKRFGKIIWDFNKIKDRLHKGIFFAINGTATSIYGDLDKTLLARLSTIEAVGVFTSSHRLIALAGVPLAAFIGAIYPKFFIVGNQS
ncbi:MAG: hypothetical protein RLZZ156_2042, partial [Deinococcota bacterium]